MQSRSVPLIHSLTIDDNDVLGVGGHANVFSGTWGAIAVAIKRFNTKSRSPEDAIVKEAEIHNACKHPNIVTLYGLYVGVEHSGLVMAKMSCSLQALLESDRLLSLQEKYQIADNVLRGLVYLHAQGWLHRDLKSGNVLLDLGNGLGACICDFGLAKKIIDQEPMITNADQKTFNVLGSLRWMAPELLKRAPHSTLTDIYAFGLTLWEMESRRRPYDRLSDKKTIKTIKKGLHEKLPLGTPPCYAQFIRQCYRTDPNARPQSASLIAENLDKLIRPQV